MTEKTVKDLTLKELIEDLDYWLVQLHYRSPPMNDEMFEILYKYMVELAKRTDTKLILDPDLPKGAIK
jgi:hypothetical protein